VSNQQQPPAALPCLPPRDAHSHKRDFGLALLVGGSRGMSGAIALAGMAALRGGAGLVKLAIPDACLETVASFEPSYMTVPLPADGEGRLLVAAKDRVSELAAGAAALACGPGLGRSPQLNDLVWWMYEGLPHAIVFDADALYALAQHRERLGEPRGPRILTPHAGEFGRLLGRDLDTREALEVAAVEKARQWNSVVVLKGHESLTTDGTSLFHNTTGNPGMATGGSGDVLTGLIVALLCQGLPPLQATRLAVHIHGLAGDLAAAELGEVSLIASDLVRFLPQAFRQMSPP
jgi:NAD(P)H-hydrate epimerase